MEKLEQASMQPLDPLVSNEKLEELKPDIGFWDGFMAERSINNTINSTSKVLESWAMEADPSFSVATTEIQEKFYKDIPQEYHDFLDESSSLKDMELRSNQLAIEMEANKKLQNAGMSANLGALFSTVLDEGALITLLGTEGMATPLLAMQKASKLKRYATAFTAGAVGIAPTEIMTAEHSAIKDSEDALMGIAMSGFLGAPFVKGAQLFKSNNVKMNELFEEIASAHFGKDSTGAARVAGSEVGYEPDVTTTIGKEIEAPEVDQDMSWWGNLRVSTVGRLQRSDNSVARKLSKILGEDSVKGGHESAGAMAARFEEMNRLKVNRISEPAFKGWKNSQNLSASDRMNDLLDSNLREEFFNQVDEVIRSGVKSADDNINKAADAITKSNRDFLKQLKEAGVEGFEDVAENERYLSRIWDSDKFEAMSSRYGDDAVESLLTNAIYKNMIDGVDDAAHRTLAQKMARAIVSTMSEKGVGREVEISRVLNNTDLDEFAKHMRSFGVDTRDIEDALEGMRKANASKKGDSGRDSRAKRRINLDESYSETITRNGKTINLSVRDLFNTNAEMTHNSYMRYASGRLALSRYGIKSDKDFDKFMDEFFDEYKGITKKDKNKIKREEMMLRQMYDQILGRPVTDMTSGFAQGTRFLRDWNFVRLMGQVGFAQVAELGNIVGHNTWGAFFAHMPALRQSLKRLENGQRADELMNELEEFVGAFGDDKLLNPAVARQEELGRGVGKAGTTVNKVDTLLQHTKRLVSDVSGMTGINKILQTMAVRTSAQKFMKEALKVFDGVDLSKVDLDDIDLSRIDKGQLKRFKLVLPNEDDLKLVLKEIKLNAKNEANWLTGRKLQSLNLKNWNPDVRETFANALYRETYRIVQKNFVGELPWYMSTNLGKVLGQFRSFVLVAHEKQMMNSVYTADKRTMNTYLSQMFFAGLAYSAQTYVNGIGRKDSKEYYRERLSAENIGKSAFQRAGFAALMPGVIDFGNSFVSNDPIFAYGRSTGLATNLLTGNPTVDLIQKAINAGGGMSKAAINDDYNYSSQDFRNATSTLWLSNILGVRNLTNLIGAELPDSSTE